MAHKLTDEFGNELTLTDFGRAIGLTDSQIKAALKPRKRASRKTGAKIKIVTDHYKRMTGNNPNKQVNAIWAFSTTQDADVKNVVMIRGKYSDACKKAKEHFNAASQSSNESNLFIYLLP